ncbi:hypothetical protein FQN57_000548 [Myotisia sp. PD_48]|nr:hypothetical protein FQN57_000548 [Myotisia sp. PD_48]
MVSFNTLFVAGMLAATTLAVPLKQQKTEVRSASGKRGLAYNDVNAAAAFKGSAASSWAYNWGTTAGGDIGGPEYVPMLWGQKFFDSWTSSADSFTSSCSSILSFNEPDHHEQAFMPPAVAAEAHKRLLGPYIGKRSIGSPAVTNGGGDMGLTWLRSFLDACAGQCGIDFLAVHWYDAAEHIQWFKKHIDDAANLAKQYNIPGGLWITEFKGLGDEPSQVRFLNEALPWLDNHGGVARYSYFMADEMVQGGQLTSVGKAYAQ